MQQNPEAGSPLAEEILSFCLLNQLCILYQVVVLQDLVNNFLMELVHSFRLFKIQSYFPWAFSYRNWSIPALWVCSRPLMVSSCSSVTPQHPPGGQRCTQPFRHGHTTGFCSSRANPSDLLPAHVGKPSIGLALFVHCTLRGWFWKTVRDVARTLLLDLYLPIWASVPL